MNTDRKQELIGLLHAALTDSPTAKPKLLDFIKEELEEFILEDRIESASSVIIRNPPINGYPLKDLQSKLLEIAKTKGVEAAVSAFDRGTTDTQTFFQYMALLEGIYVEKETQIFDGVRLVPPPETLSELSQLFNFNVSEWQLTPLCEKTLLVVDASVSPIFHKPNPGGYYSGSTFQVKENSGQFPNFDESEIYNDDFYMELCQPLSLACNSAVQISLQWRFLAKNEIFNLISGRTESTQLGRIDLSGSSTKVGKSQIEKAKRIYNEFAKFDSKQKEKLLIAVDRWIQSKTSQADTDRMIDLGVAFESLYVPDSRSESTFKLGVRAAWHLEEEPSNRKKMKKKFGEIYDWRSKAVHTGKLPKKTKNLSQEEIDAFIEEAQNYCQDSILKVLKQGKFPDNWDELIFG
ncbi:MAG: HEPN domain-containing protein [Candidatus Poribacteria bacterium]|nr:HEPN domain-containing protein [Candidatus Poribacteria bacterium]